MYFLDRIINAANLKRQFAECVYKGTFWETILLRNIRTLCPHTPRIHTRTKVMSGIVPSGAIGGALSGVECGQDLSRAEQQCNGQADLCDGMPVEVILPY